MHHNDSKLQKLVRSKRSREALSWLREGGEDYGVGEMTQQESLALVAELYQLGAQHVSAVNIPTNAGLESTDELVVTLPSEPAKRKRLFAWDAERVRLMGFEATKDVGQQFLLIWFD